VEEEQKYWTDRYLNDNTGWDIGYPSIPIKEYIDQLEDKELSILIPGAGNAYEAEYLFKQGFKNVSILDISEEPLSSFCERNPQFPPSHLICEDFFEHKGQYDLILEQTFFCSFIPSEENRRKYVKQMHQLLKTGGKLVGLWFDIPLSNDLEKRPFGGDKKLYQDFLHSFFKEGIFERAYNSIPERAERELFGIFIKEN